MQSCGKPKAGCGGRVVLGARHEQRVALQLADEVWRDGSSRPPRLDDNAKKSPIACVEHYDQVLGRTTVPCLFVEHLSTAEKRAYVLADNKIALNGSWDEELLAAELRALSSADLDVSIDLTGFSISEIDALIDLDAPEEDRNPRDDRWPCRLGCGPEISGRSVPTG